MARRTATRSVLTIHRKIAKGNKQSNEPLYNKPNVRKSFREKVIEQAMKKSR